MEAGFTLERGHSTLFGVPLVVHDLVPEFRPVLELPECGCSEAVRAEFNAYLLERFGQRRQVWKLMGKLFAHPGTAAWLRQSLDSGLPVEQALTD